MMSPIIEYLSSLERPGGGRLCRPGRSQFNILFTPNQRMVVLFRPPLGSYAAIKWALALDGAPGGVYLEVTQSGDKYVQGNVESDLMREMIPYYILYTNSQPIEVIFVNMTALNQRLIGTQWVLFINSSEDLAEVRKYLKEYSVITSSTLAREANELLKQISANLPPQGVR